MFSLWLEWRKRIIKNTNISIFLSSFANIALLYLVTVIVCLWSIFSPSASRPPGTRHHWLENALNWGCCHTALAPGCWLLMLGVVTSGGWGWTPRSWWCWWSPGPPWPLSSDGEPAAAANTEPDPDSCNLEWPLRPATVTSPALPTTVPPRAASNLRTPASSLNSVSVVTKKSLHQIVRI